MTDHERLIGALGQGELPADLAAHALSCAQCAAAVAAWRKLAPPGGAPAPGKSVVLSPSLELELKELAGRPAPSPWRAPLLLGLLQGVAAMAVVVALGKRGLVQNEAPPGAVWGLGMALGACALGGTLAAVAPGFRRVRAAIFALAAAIATVLGAAGSGLPGRRSFLFDGAVCTTVEVACAVLPMAGALWVQRRFAFDPVRAALASLAAAATGVFALHLHCGIGTSDHLYVFHVAPWLALVVLGMWIRSRLRTRSYAP